MPIWIIRLNKNKQIGVKNLHIVLLIKFIKLWSNSLFDLNFSFYCFKFSIAGQ